MYTIYSISDNQILHNPLLDTENRIVSEPVLREKLNTHGSLTFVIAPTHPLYDAIKPRRTLLKVVSDTKNRKPWFGRVMSIERRWDRTKSVYCEGELGCLNDSINRPFGHKGSPEALFRKLMSTYGGSATYGFPLVAGNVSVTDPNDFIVRSSESAGTVWSFMEDSLFGSSLGGYVLPRYDEETDTHYVDYLSLDSSDPYARTSGQTIEFGKNLLDFVRTEDASDVVTVLIPYGARLKETDPGYVVPPENDNYNGNRVTIEAAEPNGHFWVDSPVGIEMWGRIVGSQTWDDVTLPENLLRKAQQFLSVAIWQSLTLELSAVDLSFLSADIEQIQVGEYVRCKSVPHDLNALMLCTEKETHLTELEESIIILGAGQKTLSDITGGELRL